MLVNVAKDGTEGIKIPIQPFSRLIKGFKNFCWKSRLPEFKTEKVL